MITRANSSQYNKLMKIWLEANILAHPFIPEKYWQLRYEYVRTALQNSEVWVYEDAGIIQGLIGIESSFATSIGGIAVEPRYQRHGVGKILLNECKRRYKSIAIRVHVKNEPAVKFFLHNEFTAKKEELNPETKEMECTFVWDR